MRRGLILALLVVAFAGLPAAARAESGDVQIVFSFNDNWFYPQGADVDFGFFCLSQTVPIVSCEATQAYGSKLDTFRAGLHTITVTATDWEGQQTSASQSYTVVDITKPHVVFRTPTDGASFEQNSIVTADYVCEDDPGGIGLFDDACSGTVPIGGQIDTSKVGFFSFFVTTVDREFNVATEAIHYSVVDRTPPAITIGAPTDGATYTLGQQVFVDFNCEDREGSGVSTCKGDAPWGSLLDTSRVGVGTVAVSATDRAGNASRAQHSYSVVYDFAGFGSPAAAYPTASLVKAGENIPLKFSLHGDRGMDIFATGSPGWVPCGARDGASAAEGRLSYSVSNDRYTYQAATAKSWVGTCRDLVITLRDGTIHRARFTFSK